jgi:hypothetical protein
MLFLNMVCLTVAIADINFLVLAIIMIEISHGHFIVINGVVPMAARVPCGFSMANSIVILKGLSSATRGWISDGRRTVNSPPPLSGSTRLRGEFHDQGDAMLIVIRGL